MNRPCCVVTGRNHDPYGRAGNWKSFKKFLIHTVETGVQEADKRLIEAHRAQLIAAVADETREAQTLEASPVASRGSPRQYGLLDRPEESASSSSGTAAADETAAAGGKAAAPDLEPFGQVCILYDRRGLDDQHLDPNLYQICRDLFSELQVQYGDRLGLIYVVHINWFFWVLYQYVMQPFLELTGRKVVQVVETPEELTAKGCFAEEELHLQPYTPPAPGADEAAGPLGGVAGVGGSVSGAASTPVVGPNTQLMMETLRSTQTTDPITGFSTTDGVSSDSTAPSSNALKATSSAATIDR
jgi:hypothetical protein